MGPNTLRISIFLSIFNVHGNRVPRGARFNQALYFRGRFLDARHPDCAKQNEQLWADFTDAQTGKPFRVKQISGAIARRIVCWLRPGEEVKTGDRYGMIKFGSRTELLIPNDAIAEVLVKPGDKVRGGVTVLAKTV
jgi:phosphatidylserine decarboxylase